MAAKKRQATKGKSTKKKPAGKSSKRAARKSSSPKASQTMKRQARKGLKAARGGLDTVLQAGGKTWKTLKSTTAQVVEGVKETFAGEPGPPSKRSRRR